MPYTIDFSLASSPQIETALCRRLAKIRLLRNMTQAQLARQAGISIGTLIRLEKGEGVSLDTFIRVLTALGIQGNLSTLLPDPDVRPMERIRHTGTERLRAHTKKKSAESSTWTWGDSLEEKKP
jgi:putative transcriptional regulator